MQYALFPAFAAVLLLSQVAYAQDAAQAPAVEHTATPRPSPTLRALRQQKMEQRARDILREAAEFKARQSSPPPVSHVDRSQQ